MYKRYSFMEREKGISSQRYSSVLMYLVSRPLAFGLEHVPKLLTFGQERPHPHCFYFVQHNLSPASPSLPHLLCLLLRQRDMHCYFSSPTVLCNALGIIEALSALVPLHIWYIQSLQYWCMPSSYGLTTLTSSSAFMFLPPLHFSFPSMFTMALATLTSTLLFSKMIVSMCLCHHDASFTLVTSCTTASTLETQP